MIASRKFACIDAVAAAYKDGDLRDEELITVLRLGSPCDTLVRGPKAENASCTETAQCDAAGGYECVFKDAKSDGSCQIPVKQGPGADCSQPERGAPRHERRNTTTTR